MWWTLLSVMQPALAAPPGSYEVAREPVEFVAFGQGTINATIHFPAVAKNGQPVPDLSGAPYRGAAFLHGYLGSAWMYNEACDHLASMGMVVVNMDTETSIFLNVDTFAGGTIAAMDWVEDQQSTNHWLAGMVAPGPWTGMGHSMGGATLGRILQIDDRFDTLVGFMPYQGDQDADYEAMASFEGSALYLTGTNDQTATPDMVEDWFDAMANTQRGLLLNVQDAGHQAVSGFEWGDDPMPDDQQRDVVLELASSFLAAEVFGQPLAYGPPWFAPSVDYARQASRSQEPAVILEPTPDAAELALGVLTLPDAEVTVFAGPWPGKTEITEFGTVGLEAAFEVGRLTGDDGVVGGQLPADETLRASWLQVAVTLPSGVWLSPPLDPFDVGLKPEPKPPEDEPPVTDTAEPAPEPKNEPEDAPPVVSEDPASCEGCQQGPMPWLGTVLLPVMMVRRSRRTASR